MLYKLAARCRGEAVECDAGEFAHGEAQDDKKAPKILEKDGKKDDGFRPAKLFSIDRVFRNETMDATHLAEFHQVEGVVADRGLTLADLIGAPINSLCGWNILIMGYDQVSCESSSIRWELRTCASSLHIIRIRRSVFSSCI